MRFFLIISAAIWLVASSEVAGAQINLGRVLGALTENSSSFSEDFSKHIAENNKGSLAWSSLSIWMILSMMAYGARGNTEQQIRTALHLSQNDEAVKNGLRFFFADWQNYQVVGFHRADRIFFNQKFTPKDEFLKTARTTFLYGAWSPNSIDSFKPWMNVFKSSEDQTEDRSKNLSRMPTEVTSSTTMSLVSYTYFNGTWEKPFNPRRTSPKDFRVNSYKTVSVDTMCGYGEYKHGHLSQPRAEFIEFPMMATWDSDMLSMIIVMPEKVDGLAGLERDMDKLTMGQLHSSGKTDLMEVCIPKFTIKSKIPLDPLLKKMGMTDMFSQDVADFSGIIDSGRLSIHNISHEAVIEVNEGYSSWLRNGAEPSESKNGFFPIPTFSIDHPFIGFIVTRTPRPIKIFSFRYTGPTDKNYLDPSTIIFPRINSHV